MLREIRAFMPGKVTLITGGVMVTGVLYSLETMKMNIQILDIPGLFTPVVVAGVTLVVDQIIGYLAPFYDQYHELSTSPIIGQIAE